VFKTSAQLVLVDVVATNGKGEPVTDLKAEDFIVTEEGRRQTLSSFGFHPALSVGAGDEAAPAATALPPPAPGVVTNVPRYRNAGSWNVIVLDAVNSPLLEQSNTRQELLEVIEKIPDQPVAIYVLGTELRMIQDFSSDPKALKQVIAGLKNRAPALLDNPRGGHEAERYEGVWFNSLSARTQESIIRWEGEGTAARTRSRLQITLDALTAIARSLKPLPGRKNLIWVSEGFPFTIDPGNIIEARESVSATNYKVAIASTANALFDSQVAIYPIDSRGMLSPGFYDATSRGYDPIGRKATQIGPTSTTTEENSNLDVTHTSMQEIAERTGGRAFYNRNEIGNAVLESLNDGAVYYSLAYSPTNKNWNGKFRRIHIKTRDGVKLRYRLGYFAMPVKSASAAEQAAALQRAMDINTPASTGLLFQAKVLGPSSSGGNRLVINYAILASGLSFQKGPDQLQHLSVGCAVEAYPEKGASRKDASTYTAALQNEVYERVVREGFPCQQKLELPPGNYVLRLGVRDNGTGQIGTADVRITVPARPVTAQM